jgi:hypothetical protein
MKYQGTNSAPTADAGDDFSTPVNAQAALDGTGSSDPDGGGLFYTWTQVSGEAVELSDPSVAQPTFTPTEVGELVFQLVVSDGELTSEPDTVTVTVTEAPVDDDAADDDAADDDAADDDAADDDGAEGDDDDDSGCGC